MASITWVPASRLPAAAHCSPATAWCTPSASLPLNKATRPRLSITVTCRYWLQPLLLNARSRAAAGSSCWPSSRSRICGPKAGRVTFWVATAPTPARTQGQRAPTAMLDELMAIPSCPVSGQRPMMENVIALLLMPAPAASRPGSPRSHQSPSATGAGPVPRPPARWRWGRRLSAICPLPGRPARDSAGRSDRWWS
ncbi:hypothetical protein D9M68_730670 [compost metagenome]